jgi:DNA-binding FadR family transcriptional regulator
MNSPQPGLGLSTPSRSAHHLVVHGIGRRIVAGQYPIGSTLPGDAELMERFSVSRSVLREALKTLAAKGLVEPKTKVGTRILDEKRWNMFDADILAWRLQRGADAPFFENLFDIRQALEPLAAASAALRRSDEDIARIEAAWRRMGPPDQTREGFTIADLAFHRAILDASGNPFLHSIGSVIETALAAAFALSAPVDDPERFALALGQHRAILDAIVARDADAASDAMTVVIFEGTRWTSMELQAVPTIAIALRLFGR